MEEGTTTTAGTTTTSAASIAGATNPTLSQQQQQLFQQQLFLLHQYQQHQQQHQHQQHQQSQSQPQSQQQQQQQHSVLSLQQQQQQAISRFPSNIDAHLRAPGLRSLHLQQQQQQQQSSHASAINPSAAAASAAAAHHLQLQQQQQAKAAASAAAARQGGNPVEVEMAHQDAMKVCNPDVKRPFASIEDAVLRLLPYHVVSDFEAEEDDRVLDSDTTGQIPSRLQQWDHNILAKIAEFTTTFEKQVLAFNIMSRKRALGEFRSEERLMIEQALLQEEKQAILEIRAEIESRERANREAAEVKMKMAMAHAEQARVEAHAHAEMMARAPMRANALGSHGDNHSGGQDVGPEQGGNMEDMIHGWGNNNNNNNNGQRDDEEPSEDFLNDENEPENGEEAGSQEEWREVGEFDLNTR